MDGFQVVSKKDFEAIEDTNTKLNILYGYIIDLGDNLKNTNLEMEKLKKQTKWHKATSAVAGFIGGFFAGLTKRFY